MNMGERTTNTTAHDRQPTLAEIRDHWPPTVDIPTAGRVFGLSRSHSYALAARGDFPVNLIKVGHRYRVSTLSILRILSAGAA
jgi:hypothetical protein